jgi:hypothetical protein
MRPDLFLTIIASGRSIAYNQTDAYQARVIADGGTFEAYQCVANELVKLNQ